jgi:hypothetical protein
MKISSYWSRSASTALTILTLIFTASGQAGLRNALDFDGDGRADYHVRTADSSWSIKTNNDTFFSHPFGDPSEEFHAPGDYDGDGIGDIAVFNDTTGTWVWRESSTGAFVTQDLGQLGDVPVARDYDGDGKTDPAIARYGGGVITWIIQRSSDGVETSTAWGEDNGVNGDFVAPGDYDGDGLFDLAVQHPEGNGTSTFLISYSQGGTDSIIWGTDTDFNNPGDYDGDGKTDIAVTREGGSGELVWDIRRSSDLAQMTFNWGVFAGDLAVQNDYDGDGRSEVAVWRVAEGRFYLLNTFNLSVNLVPWGDPNDFPIAAYDTH